MPVFFFVCNERFETKQKSKLQKEDKGTTLVVMNKNDKTQEGPVQTNDLNNYKREV